MNQLSAYTTHIHKLCSTYGVRHLYAFGSVLTDKFNSESDIDLMVDFLPINSAEYADNYYELKFSLENILNRKIDLLEEKAIKNPFFLQVVNSQKQMLYGN